LLKEKICGNKTQTKGRVQVRAKREGRKSLRPLALLGRGERSRSRRKEKKENKKTYWEKIAKILGVGANIERQDRKSNLKRGPEHVEESQCWWKRRRINKITIR
jgi:hypothetical protein